MLMRNDGHSLRRALTAAACVAISATGAGCVLVMSGCSQPMLAPTDVRSPFDRYDAVRSQHAQQYVEDKYGRRQPNLRARLAPKE